MRILSFITALAIFASVPSSSLGQDFTPPSLPSGAVIEVRVVGAVRVDVEAVLGVVGTQAGEVLSAEQLDADLRAIWALERDGIGWFEDVQIDVRENRRGLIVTFGVFERPQIASVTFEFVDGDFLASEVRGQVETQSGNLFDPVRLAEDAEALETFYQQEGFALALVEVHWVREQDEDVPVVFEVAEGRPLEVSRVNVSGNDTARDGTRDQQLLAILETSRPSFWSLFGEDTHIEEGALDGDRERLQAYYYQLGFLSVVVEPAFVELTRDGRGLVVTFHLVEGPLYRVGAVTIRGDSAGSGEDLLTTEDNSPFDGSSIHRDLEGLRRHYRDLGYAQVVVDIDLSFDEMTGVADIEFVVVPGLETTVGRIAIEGNERTRDAVIRRELDILEADRFSHGALETSLGRLRSLGLFESVDVAEAFNSDTQQTDLTFTVEERDSIQWAGRFAYGRVTGAVVSGLLAAKNLFGRGQTIAVELDLVSEQPRFAFSFLEPRLFGSDWAFRGEAFSQEVLYPDFSRVSTGLSVEVGTWPLDDLGLTLGYQIEDVELQPRGALGEVASGDGLNRTGELRLGLTWDRRDNRQAPQNGFLQSISADWANTVLGSEEQFVRLEALSRWYVEPLPDLVLKLNTSIGYLIATDSSTEIGVSERYFSGGQSSVRGFDSFVLTPQRAGVLDPSDPGSTLVDSPFGGNKRFIINLEAQFPLLPFMGLSGVVFADAGNAFSEEAPFSVGLDLFEGDTSRYDQVLRTAAGFGLRWQTGVFGTVRLDLGFPLAPLDGEASPVIFFGAGTFL